LEPLSEIPIRVRENQIRITKHIILTGDTRKNPASAISAWRAAFTRKPTAAFRSEVTNFGKDRGPQQSASRLTSTKSRHDEFTINTFRGSTKSISWFAKLMTEAFMHASRIPDDRCAPTTRSLVVRAIKDVSRAAHRRRSRAEARDSETISCVTHSCQIPPEAQQDYFYPRRPPSTTQTCLPAADDFDAIILANVADLSESTCTTLSSISGAAAGSWFSLARNPSTFTTNNLPPFSFFRAPERPGRSRPGREILHARRTRTTTIPLSPSGRSRVRHLGSARFYRAFQLLLSPTPKSPDAGLPHHFEVRRWLARRDGTTWGLGRVIMFSSTADTAWNDLPVRLFVRAAHSSRLGSIVQRQDEGLTSRWREITANSHGILDHQTTFTKPGHAPVNAIWARRAADGRPTLQ